MAAEPAVEETPAIRISGVSKRLRNRVVADGGVLAVDGLDLEVRRGQVLGLAGPNGAGKSMTLRMLLGLVRPSAGTLELFGEPVKPGAAVLGRVGALIDGPGFVPHLSGHDNLRLALRLRHLPSSDEALAGPIALAGLGAALERPYSTYSHGMRYRLGLARALLGDPELLLLDEPATGLDPAQVLEVRAAIGARAAAGTTIVFSSHVLSEVERVCSHVAVMREGRLLAHGPTAEVRGDSDSLEDAYLLLVD